MAQESPGDMAHESHFIPILEFPSHRLLKVSTFKSYYDHVIILIIHEILLLISYNNHITINFIQSTKMSLMNSTGRKLGVDF